MVRLKTCRDCRHMVSPRADTCSHCGVSKPGQGFSQRHPLTVLFVLGTAIYGTLNLVAPMDTNAGGTTEIVVPEAPAPLPAACLTPSRQLIENIASGLNVDGGGSLSDSGATKSGSHANAFFVAARINGPGMGGDMGVWATNQLDGSGMIFSVDNMAQAFSVFPDGGRTQAAFSMADPGARQSRDCVG